MAIVLTEQPAANGYYSGYLPVKFVATETANNPAYLIFTLKTSEGADIPNVPSYKASNIGDEFTFDASNYLRSIFKVRTKQGLSTTAIEELTDVYGKFEVVVSSDTAAISDLTSNEFYAFANIDGLRYLNDQTANDGISRKALLYGSELKANKTFAFKIQGQYDRAVIFATDNRFYVETYVQNRPVNSDTVLQRLQIDISSLENKLISIPLNRAFIISNFTPILGGFILALNGFRAIDAGTNNKIYYYLDDYCNDKEFVFINKYGVKENVKFRSYNNEDFQTKGDTFQVGGYQSTGEIGYFNTSANNEKINQISSTGFEVKGQRFLASEKEMLKDFVSSPLAWVVESNELKPIYISDGNYKMVDKSRGVDFRFKYEMAQTKLAFK